MNEKFDFLALKLLPGKGVSSMRPVRITDRLYIIAETYGQDKGSPFYQMGLRYWIVPNHVQIDTTFGSQIGNIHDERWASIGLRLITSPLF